jgi:beta-lactamase class C
MRLAITAATVVLIAAPAASADAQIEQTVARHISTIVPADGAGGVAVALRLDGRALFFNYGWADRATKRPITGDTLFNLASLRKVFETTLLAQAVHNRELTLDEPVAKYVSELEQASDIGRVTLGQLATHTSGLLLPQDHPPWPHWGYTLSEFIRTLNDWKADKPPGTQHTYTHAGYILLQLALERRYRLPIDQLIEQRILRPLAMTSRHCRGAITVRADTSPPRRSALRCRAMPTTGSRSDSPAAKKATTIGRVRVRCTPRRATWRFSSPPTSARCPSNNRYGRR